MKHPCFSKIDHRPWPLPEMEWTWRQSWNELLFVHYPVRAKDLAHLIPPSLKIQEFEGTSYVGIVPFRMNRVMRRPLPDVPWFSHFLELNVRLYVEHQGKPGVWFLSLDATNPLVVWGGNKFFGLPYRNADISLTTTNDQTAFRSKRKGTRTPAEFEVRFKKDKDVFDAKTSSLEHFLSERYCFYSLKGKKLTCTEVHHLPWPLQKAEGEVMKNSLLTAFDIPLESKPILHYSSGVDVVSWNPRLIV